MVIVQIRLYYQRGIHEQINKFFFPPAGDRKLLATPCKRQAVFYGADTFYKTDIYNHRFMYPEEQFPGQFLFQLL